MIPRWQHESAEHERTAWGITAMVCLVASAVLVEAFGLHVIGGVFAGLATWAVSSYRRAGRVVRAYELQAQAEGQE